MTKHKTGTREQWLAARRELLKAEKELTRRSDELARRRQELPWVRIDKKYAFETDEGSASLPDLFRDRKSTRLNSSHGYISYAVFCLKKKTKKESGGMDVRLTPDVRRS